MPGSQLVDRFGQPVSTAALAEPPRLRRSSRKPPVFNPEPERLVKLFKLADEGDPRELQQTCADLEGRDGHFGGVLETRRRAVTRLPWTATAATDDALDVEIADAVKRHILDAPWFKPMIRALLDAVVKGWSVCAITWDTADIWKPSAVRWVDQQMTAVTPEDDQRLAWRDVADESKLQPILPYTAVVHAYSDPSGPLYRRGIGRALAMLYSFKRLGLSAWASFIEMYGVARPVVSYTPGAKQSEIDDLENRILQWMHGGYLLKPKTMDVAFPEPANTRSGSAGGDPVQANLARWCDEQASKRIVGQTMTSDSGSSRAQGEVHERVAGWITEGDADELAETITRDLVEPYVRLNYGVDAPVPKIAAQIESSERREFQLRALEVLVPLGLRVEQSIVRDLAGFPEPAEDAELLTPPRSGAPGGASRRRSGAGLELPAGLSEAELVALARRLKGAPAVAAAALPQRLRAAQALAQRGNRFADEDHEDIVDRDAGGAAGENWRADLQPFVEAVEGAAEEASGFDDFLRKLGRRSVDGDRLVRNLATASMQLRGVGDGTDEVE